MTEYRQTTAPSFADLRAQMSPLPKNGTRAPDGREFPWGPIQQIHSINGIDVVEYLCDNSNLGNPSERSVRQHGQPLFHAYLDGRSTNTSYRSLDSALVGAIAYRRSGPNSQASRHFDLMTLGAIPNEG